jgi:hypothetical protein
MTEHDSSERVTDDVAHRLLARAVELDETQRAALTLGELREVAREAGISTDAFERALSELRAVLERSDIPAWLAPPVGRDEPGLLRTLWRRITGDARSQSARVSAWEPIATNVIAVALFFFLFGLSSRISHSIGAPWQLNHLLQLPAYLLGAGVAFRLQARAVAYGLAGLGIAAAVKYAMHLAFGIETVQGGPTQLAVMIAGVAGVALGGWMMGRRSAGRETRPSAHAEPERAPAPNAPSESALRGLFSLRARTA